LQRLLPEWGGDEKLEKYKRKDNEVEIKKDLDPRYSLQFAPHIGGKAYRK